MILSIPPWSAECESPLRFRRKLVQTVPVFVCTVGLPHHHH